MVDYFNKILMKIEKIEVLRFIRWCKIAKNIYENKEIIKSILEADNIIDDNYIIGFQL
jgi:hypothetical protein